MHDKKKLVLYLLYIFLKLKPHAVRQPPFPRKLNPGHATETKKPKKTIKHD